MLRQNLSSGFQTRSDTNWAVKPQTVARGLKFPILLEVDVKSKYKSADCLREYYSADLLLLFCIPKVNKVFT